MEALEKDFSDLVASEDAVETDTDQVTAEAGVEDIVQQILSANADQSVDEPTVAEDEETSEEETVAEEEVTSEEEPVEEVETEEILEEEDAEDDDELQAILADENGWEDIAEEDLEEMQEILAELKAEDPEFDFDNVDIVINEDGTIDIYEFIKLTKKQKDAGETQGSLKKKKKKRSKTKSAKRAKMGLNPLKRMGSALAAARARRAARYTSAKDSFDPSEVSADTAVVTSEESVQEYAIFRTIDGEIKMAKDTTKKDEKDIGEEPKSVDHKDALSTALKRVWKAREVEGVTTEESYDPTNDVSALLTGEELSEEFKEKATTIFEAAVNNEVDRQLALAEAEVHSVFDSAVNDAKTELTEQLDNYFDYVADQWFEDNKVAIDTGIRSEIAENFISGLKTLFTENYVEVPESKTDVLQELAKQMEELKASLNEQLNSNISLKQELAELKRHEIVQSVSSDLTVTEVEKLKELSEGIKFEDESDFVSKLETIKESYFPTKTVEPVQQEEEQEESFEVLSESMDVYSSVLTRSTQR